VRKGIRTEGRKDHEDPMVGEGKLISNSLPVKGFRRQFPDEERPAPEIGISFVAIKMGRWSGLGRTVRAGLAVRGRISRPIRLAAGDLLINCKICEKVRLASFYAHKLSYEFIENSHRDHLGNDPVGEAIWNDRVAYFGSRCCECPPDGVPNHLGRIAAGAFFE
jgi:hypothetical protein